MRSMAGIESGGDCQPLQLRSRLNNTTMKKIIIVLLAVAAVVSCKTEQHPPQRTGHLSASLVTCTDTLYRELVIVEGDTLYDTGYFYKSEQKKP